MKELSLDVITTQLTPRDRLLVNQDTVDEIHKLAEDPDYGQEFLELYLNHLNVLTENKRCSHNQYVNAIKFFSLVESGNSLTDSFIKTFPERYEDRRKNFPPAEQKKDIMRSEASRYNNSVTVNEIRKVAAIPVQLIHRHLLHEAILEQADLMKNARSEMVRQKAGACLIQELKPAEDQTINIDVNDGASDAIADLRAATVALAAAERQSVLAGVPLSTIAASDIIDVTPDPVDEPEPPQAAEVAVEKKPVRPTERWSLK